MPAGTQLTYAQATNLVSIRMNGLERVRAEGDAPFASRFIRRVSGVTYTPLGIADKLVVLRTPFAPRVLTGSSIAVARASDRAIELAWFSAPRPGTEGHPTLTPPESFRVESIDVFSARLLVFGKTDVDEIVERVNAERTRSLEALEPIYLADFAKVSDEVARTAFAPGR